jgi:drug/metabolite transporter (DMT)-like permease
VNPALWGAGAALCLGTGVFAGRYSARAMGPDVAYFGVLAVGSVILSAWVAFTGLAFVADAEHAWLLLVNGIATVVMTVLLYAGLARGPVSVVAPIVASHPVLVVGFWVALGAAPSPLQWLAMGATIGGVVIVAKSSAGDAALRSSASTAELRMTLLLAAGACLAHAVMVLSGQAAVVHYGELQTLWLGRLIGLTLLAVTFLLRRRAPRVPLRWVPLVCAQGVLDAAGYLFLFAGSEGEGREIAAVVASAFGAVTTILARIVLREAMSGVQWAGVAVIFLSIAVLSYPG